MNLNFIVFYNLIDSNKQPREGGKFRMTYEFIAAGNVMLDKVIFSDGTQSGKEHIGGPATFAYSGIRLFTDNVIQCSNVGATDLSLLGEQGDVPT